MATIRKRGDSYQIRVSCGYDTNGKQIIRAKTWKPEKESSEKQKEKELQRVAVLFEEQCQRGLFIDSTIKFSSFSEVWIRDYAEKQLRATTVFNYKHMLTVINGAIGHLRIDRVQPHHLLRFYDELETAKNLSGKTVLNYHRLISSVLETAVKWQIIVSNPCIRVQPPKAERKEARFLDEKQAAQILELLENETLKFRAMITLLLYSGMRRGELCGLTWGDIDFNTGIVDINKSSLYLSGQGVFDDTTKSKTSARAIKLPHVVIATLHEWKKEQTLICLQSGSAWTGKRGNECKVFTQDNGKPIHPCTITKTFYKFIEKYNLPKISIHSLRHTNATLMIASGVDLRTVSKRLGHAQTSTTTNIYTHAIRRADEIAADVIDDILTPKKAVRRSI